MLRRALPFLAAAAALALFAAPASAQKQMLGIEAPRPPSTHPMVKAQQAWIKTIEEASGGNLTVVVGPAPLAKPGDRYEVVVHVPAVLMGLGRRGRYSMLMAGEIPFLCPSAGICSRALWKWYHKHGLADGEFTDGKLLNVYVTGSGAIHTVRPVKTLEEVKGIKVRATYNAVAISRALGMSYITVSSTSRAREMLSRGTAQGVLSSFARLDSLRLTDVVKAHLEVPGGLYRVVFITAMEKVAYARLTPANQAALMKASGEAGSALFGKAWDAVDDRARKGAGKRGDTIETLAPAELERWRPLLEFVRDDWLEKAKDRGLDGEMLLEDLEATIKASR